MARLPRLFAPSIVQHVVQRVAPGRVICTTDDDYATLLRTLAEAARAHGLALHAYVLLPHEIQLLGTPARADTLSRVMQDIGRRFVPHANRRDQRLGTLWDRRFRSTLIDADAYLLPVMQHIEHRSIAVGLAIDPDAWAWSSRAHHVGHRQQSLITDHAAYWALSDTPFGRQAAYREALPLAHRERLAAVIESAVLRGWALGDDRFVEMLSALANRRAHALRRGRPRRADSVANDDQAPLILDERSIDS